MISRYRTDLLAPWETRRWVHVRTMTGRIVRSCEVPAGADPRAAMKAVADELGAEGWKADFDSHYAFFVARRGGERLQVSVSVVVPPTVAVAAPALAEGMP